MSAVIDLGTKSPGSRWEVRWRTPSGSSRRKRFRTLSEANDWRASVEHRSRTGEYVDPTAGNVTLDQYARTWIDTRRSRDGAPLRPRTRALYVQLLESHIAPRLGAKRLRDVTPSVVRQWHAQLPGSTVPAKAYRLLRAIMSTAVDDELIARNPCRVVGGGIERAPERPIPTRDEVWALADAIEPRYRALVLTAGFVGLRWGELLGLRRADVDLDHRLVHVRRQLVEVDGAIVTGPPKTDAGSRTVAVPPAIVAELRSHLDEYVGDSAAAPVFVGPKGAAPRRSNFNVVWSRAREQVGRSDLRLHDLRHFAHTLAASAGATTRELMARLGHASPAAALRYQHATAERDQLLAERMSALIEGVDERTGPALRVLPGGR